MKLAHVLTASVMLACGVAQSGTAHAQEHADTARPNFVVVLIDDAALMDLGAYGGEAKTPNIDALAARGALFTQYRTSPLCAPSRAMLLTGLDSHLTGVATIPEVLPPEQAGKAGYTMHLEPGVTTIASRLQISGYRTLMTGKWHLGHGDGDLPDAHGFDRSFVLDASGADNWEQKPYMPYYRAADWFEDGKPVSLPDDYYSSRFLVDRMISYIDSGKLSDQPFFAYVAFQAVHIPIQAPKEFTQHYEGVYDAGWDELRQSRWERAKTLDLVPTSAQLAPKRAPLRDWENLTSAEQAIYAKSMAVNAGMLEAMDHHFGRLVDYLKSENQYENTVFIITSDNGPEPSHPIGEPGFGTWMAFNGYTHTVENLGEKGSYAFIGPEWAIAASSPSDLFKFYASEGGLRVPLIAAGPGIDAARTVQSSSFVMDIAPTIRDYAGLDTPDSEFTGRSLRPVLSNTSARTYGAEEPVGMEVSGNSALFKGNWKLLRNMPPWGTGEWQLFNLSLDPGETSDMALAEPARFADLKADYEEYANANGVLSLPEGFDVHKQLASNVVSRQFDFFGWILGVIGVLGAGFIWLIWRKIKRLTTSGRDA